ncbi:SulP family inorganic anion transporter [Bradyrhizobium erythrophlei]|jgi:SulP family sulfate permease|uniref:Sulfate permease, MFS superfamily n=1 Tax=Bradyrhizobium erythrophlei TaxID=1437360 RepID=A0A1M7TY60_9BRAD|nr:SulP family inorganic anion transporter [Bradyrhizobium erythrophlei]SHN75669.1 Sulfate permease, MFS superfamily [Bradyrhizobium erythrophlei]
MADQSGSSSGGMAWPVFRSLSGYRLSYLSRDLFAGLTLAAIVIPEQMATARLGGFAPQIGFFAFMAGSIAFAVFGGNRFLSSGADSTITPIFAGGLAALAAVGSPDYATLAAALALMTGMLLAAAGIFRLGWIADLLSIPVTIGFLTGISAHILISQLPAILGLPSPEGPMLQRLAALLEHLGETNGFTLVIGLGVLAIVALSEQIDARIPGALIGLALAAAAVVLLRLESRGVSVLGGISVDMPALTVPIVSVSRLTSLLSLSLIISVVVMVQTAATTRSFPTDPNEPPDVNRDFIGVGIGSVLAGLVGAFPVNASPPRTAVVSETGGRSQIAGLTAVAIVVLLLAFGTSLLHRIPNAALAGVLLFVALRIIRFRQIASVLRQSLGEFLLILATAAGIIVLPIEQGVGLGIALSLLHGIWSTTRARVQPFERVPGTSIWWPVSAKLPGEQESGVIVVGFQAPLSFLNAYDFRRDILAALKSPSQKIRLLVLEATGIVEIDFTAAQVLTEVIRQCHGAGIDFAIARLESTRAQAALVRFGINTVLGTDREFQSVEEAIRARAGKDPTG